MSPTFIFISFHLSTYLFYFFSLISHPHLSLFSLVSNLSLFCRFPFSPFIYSAILPLCLLYFFLRFFIYLFSLVSFVFQCFFSFHSFICLSCFASLVCHIYLLLLVSHFCLYLSLCLFLPLFLYFFLSLVSDTYLCTLIPTLLHFFIYTFTVVALISSPVSVFTYSLFIYSFVRSSVSLRWSSIFLHLCLCLFVKSRFIYLLKSPFCHLPGP